MISGRSTIHRIGQILICAFFVLLLTSFTAAQTNNLTQDEAAIVSNIEKLRTDDGDVRATAAKSLRQIIAKYSSGNTNIRSKDGGRAFWIERVDQVMPGMSKAEVAKLLPAFLIAPERSTFGSGQSHYESYRLDHDWVIRISNRNPDKVIERPTLIARELALYVTPPAKYTGTWICWHVNGQKSYEIQFADGKYDGVFTKFHDNGQKAVEQHYATHKANGTDTGWYPDGKVMYTGQYKNGKQHGQWIHLYPDGKKAANAISKTGNSMAFMRVGTKTAKCALK